MSTAVLPAADAIRVFVATIFPLALMQAKERKDRHYNDDQADQINKTVHINLRRTASHALCLFDGTTEGGDDCSRPHPIFNARAAQNTANRLDFTSWANAGAIKIQLLHRLFARAARE